MWPWSRGLGFGFLNRESAVESPRPYQLYSCRRSSIGTEQWRRKRQICDSNPLAGFQFFDILNCFHGE